MLKNTQILPKGTLDTIKRSRPIYTIGRKVRFAVGELLGLREVPGLTGRTHYNDFMLVSTDPAVVETYVRGANQFIDILERSCSEAGRDPSTIGEVLEVGCGYGRIVRELRKRMPAARVHVSDVIDGAARFTAAEFGCYEMPPLEDAGAEYNERFDLVYLLSVYTHLRRDFGSGQSAPLVGNPQTRWRCGDHSARPRFGGNCRALQPILVGQGARVERVDR